MRSRRESSGHDAADRSLARRGFGAVEGAHGTAGAALRARSLGAGGLYNVTVPAAPERRLRTPGRPGPPG